MWTLARAAAITAPTRPAPSPPATPSAEMKKVYGIVDAQKMAQDAVAAGRSAADPGAIARDYIYGPQL